MRISRIAACCALVLAAGASWGGEFVEVSLRFEASGTEIFNPTFVVETGRTADIRQVFNPNSANSANGLANVFGMEQRVLATVNRRAGDEGYGVRFEYMQRYGTQWVSRMGPTLYVDPYADASMEVTAGGDSFVVSASVTPRYELTSLADVRSFESPGFEECVPNEARSEPGTSYFNPIGGPFGNDDCCTVPCDNGNTLTCCNSCCSDSVLCPGKSCCGGNHP